MCACFSSGATSCQKEQYDGISAALIPSAPRLRPYSCIDKESKKRYGWERATVQNHENRWMIFGNIEDLDCLDTIFYLNIDFSTTFKEYRTKRMMLIISIQIKVQMQSTLAGG